MLPFVGQGNGQDFAARFSAPEDYPRIFHRKSRSYVAVNPPDFRLLVGHRPFGNQIEDVVGPVLNRNVLNFCSGRATSSTTAL